jgi:hypothetical protein
MGTHLQGKLSNAHFIIFFLMWNSMYWEEEKHPFSQELYEGHKSLNELSGEGGTDVVQGHLPPEPLLTSTAA